MLLITLPAVLNQGLNNSPPAGRGKQGTFKHLHTAASIYSLSWPKQGHAKKGKGLAAIHFCLHKVNLLKPFQEMLSAKLACFHPFIFNFPLNGFFFFFPKQTVLVLCA